MRLSAAVIDVLFEKTHRKVATMLIRSGDERVAPIPVLLMYMAGLLDLLDFLRTVSSEIRQVGVWRIVRLPQLQ